MNRFADRARLLLVFCAAVGTSRIAACQESVNSVQSPRRVSQAVHQLFSEPDSFVKQVSLQSIDSADGAALLKPVATDNSVQPAASGPESQSGAAATATKPFIDLRTESVGDTLTEGADTSRESRQELLVRLGVWTVVVMCLAVLTVLGIRRWQRSRGILPQMSSHSRVLQTVGLGGNRSVSLVQVDDVRVLVGSDASGIRNMILAPVSFPEELIHSAEAADTDVQSQAGRHEQTAA